MGEPNVARSAMPTESAVFPDVTGFIQEVYCSIYQLTLYPELHGNAIQVDLEIPFPKAPFVQAVETLQNQTPEQWSGDSPLYRLFVAILNALLPSREKDLALRQSERQ
jgi:hypothetical protein